MARSTVVAILVFGFAFVGGLGVPEPVSAEYCRTAMPDHARDARGYTFRASITGIRTEVKSFTLTYVTMAIDKVYANRDYQGLRAGASIEVYSNPCDGFGLLRLEVKDEILMSTKYLEEGPSTWNTALWRVEGDTLRLAVLKGSEFDKVWFTADRRIEKADTLREALALVAPNAIGMPDTATDGVRDSRVPAWLALLAGVCAFVLATLVLHSGNRRETRSWRDRDWGRSVAPRWAEAGSRITAFPGRSAARSAPTAAYSGIWTNGAAVVLVGSSADFIPASWSAGADQIAHADDFRFHRASRPYLQAYLDDFALRYIRPASRSRRRHALTLMLREGQGRGMACRWPGPSRATGTRIASPRR